MTLDRPGTTTITDIGTGLGHPCNVILYNDECHAMDEVVAQLVKATNCSESKALAVMFEAHNTGRAVAFSGNKERCELVCSILEQIRLRTDIEEA
jgi:ATP-dependent Clp protease adapter protein ClpS